MRRPRSIKIYAFELWLFGFGCLVVGAMVGAYIEQMLR
ncbi:hypothetical protein SEA_LYELL_108 [Microbacterium phage Lyell]|nr:hypothetical protein SEA_LYELL_108 [Microbacterium phage Lyell]